MEILIDYSYREEALRELPIEALAVFTLTQEELGEGTEVSISFIDDEEMAELNGRYRGKEGPTDVLSFECDGLDDEELFEDGESEVFELGDIVIAPDVAERQSKDFGTSFEEEISLLLVHGLLHLCGYDHIVDEEAEVMEAREAEILDAWKESRA